MTKQTYISRARVAICTGALAVSLQASCAGDDKETSTTQAEAADWIHPDCTADALQPPSSAGGDACNGPWTFDYVDTATDRTLCGEDTTQTCQTYNACTSWDLTTPGDNLGVDQFSGHTGRSGNFISTCSSDGSGDCDTTSRCVAQAASYRASYILNGAPAWSLPAFTTQGVTVVDSVTTTTVRHVVTRTTRYGCDVNFTNEPTMMIKQRAACGCAHYPAKTCQRDHGTIVTAPGQTKPTSPGAPTTSTDIRTFSSGPTCLTCDQIPADSDANVQAKFDCLNSGLATATDDLKSSLAARVKLMLQLFGERLTPTQRTRAEGVYNEDPNAAPFCSVPISWDPSCQPDADTAHVTGQLQICQDLLNNPAASQGAAGAELATCFTQLTSLGGLSNTCQLTMRNSTDATVQSVIKKAQPSFAGDFSVALPLAFSRIGAWWSAATALAAGDQQWFMGQSSSLQQWLWSTIEAQRMPLPQTDPTKEEDAAVLLADVASTRFTSDIAVLTSAFSEGQTDSAPPLLTLTGDALQGLADRISRLEPIHDVGCRFAPCKTDTTLRTSATSELVRAFATLPDATAFTAALAAATTAGGGHLQEQLPDLYAALDAMRAQHAYLETAWNILGRPEPFASLATITDPPTEAAGLAAIVRAAAVASSSYEASGEFVPWNRPRLSAATLRQPDLLGFIDLMVAGVNKASSDFADNRLKIVDDLLDQSRSGAALQSQIDQLTELRARVVDLAQRIDGIDQREGTERAALAGYQAEFEALVASAVLDPNAAYQVATLPVLSASALDTHHPNGGLRNIVRDQFAMVPLKTGESLRVQVTGQWAPDCSVSTATLFDPVSNLPRSIDLVGALTGPEGYLATWQTDHYSAAGEIHDDSSGGGTTEKVDGCFSLPIPGINIGACLGSSDGDSSSTTERDSQGSETKVSATFMTGIRLDSTPYPDAPAGSLVAVLTRPGVTGNVLDPQDLDVRVVHNDDLIVASTVPADLSWPVPNDGIEVHFVVNDRGEPPSGTLCLKDSTAIQINMVKVTPFGNVAKQVGTAMADTLAAVEGEAPAVLAQGELTVDEETALRADAWARVEQALQPSGIGLSGLPAELRQQFDAFLERELASMSRRGQRLALQRELDQLVIEMDAITHQQQFSADQDRLLHLIPRWRLRALTGIELASSTVALSEALNAYVAPIYELRDPAAFTNFRTLVSTQISKIIDLEITAPYEDSLADLVLFATSARDALSAAEFELPTSQRRTIIFAIPRPPGSGRPAWTGPWRTVSDTTAHAFWDSVFDGQGHLSANAIVTLSPSDIYTGPGGASQLSCGDLAPVVRHVGLYFATEGSDSVLGPAGTEISVIATATGPVWFPLVGRAVSFESTDPLGTRLSIPALNGNTFNVLGDSQTGTVNFGTWPADLGAGAGISPFTSFSIDMRAFAPPQSQDVQDVLTKTNALFVVFDVERQTSVPVAWVPGVCQLL